MLGPLIKSQRADYDAFLLVDVGDMLQGTALADDASENPENTPHPVISAMNILGYDVACLGNHDFDYGLDFLERAIADASFPMLCANLLKNGENGKQSPISTPTFVIDKQVIFADGLSGFLRVGFIGVAPPQTVKWNAAALHGAITAIDAVETVKQTVPRLRSQGADIIIALCHTGLGEQETPPLAEDFGRSVARIEGVDAILMGHRHQCFPGVGFESQPDIDAVSGRINGKPAIMAGCNGRFLGVVDLQLDHSPTGWKITNSAAKIMPVVTENTQPCKKVLAASQNAHNRTLQRLDRVVATTSGPVHGFFNLIGQAPAQRLLAEAQRWRAAQLIAGTSLEGLPILSVAAPFMFGGRGDPTAFVDIAAGNIRERQLLNIAPFPNRLNVIELSGAQLRDWIERAVSGFSTIPRGTKDEPLLVPLGPVYNLDIFHGAEFMLDISTPPLFDPVYGHRLPNRLAHRICDLRVEGRKVQDTDRFAVAVNAYRACGGGGFGMLNGDMIKLSSGETLRQTLSAYLRAVESIIPDQHPTFRFAKHDATIMFDTSPTATSGLLKPNGLDLQDMGLTSVGLRRFKVAI